MSLFVVYHKHDENTCPAGDPRMGAMLLMHVSPANASKSGITIHSEAVLNGKHTFYLIVDAADEAKVKQFMTPFAQMGSVEVWPASTCEQVVARAKC